MEDVLENDPYRCRYSKKTWYGGNNYCISPSIIQAIHSYEKIIKKLSRSEELKTKNRCCCCCNRNEDSCYYRKTKQETARFVTLSDVCLSSTNLPSESITQKTKKPSITSSTNGKDKDVCDCSNLCLDKLVDLLRLQLQNKPLETENEPTNVVPEITEPEEIKKEETPDPTKNININIEVKVKKKKKPKCKCKKKLDDNKRNIVIRKCSAKLITEAPLQKKCVCVASEPITIIDLQPQKPEKFKFLRLFNFCKKDKQNDNFFLNTTKPLQPDELSRIVEDMEEEEQPKKRYSKNGKDPSGSKTDEDTDDELVRRSLRSTDRRFSQNGKEKSGSRIVEEANYADFIRKNSKNSKNGKERSGSRIVEEANYADLIRENSKNSKNGRFKYDEETDDEPPKNSYRKSSRNGKNSISGTEKLNGSIVRERSKNSQRKRSENEDDISILRIQDALNQQAMRKSEDQNNNSQRISSNLKVIKEPQPSNGIRNTSFESEQLKLNSVQPDNQELTKIPTSLTTEQITVHVFPPSNESNNRRSNQSHSIIKISKEIDSNASPSYNIETFQSSGPKEVESVEDVPESGEPKYRRQSSASKRDDSNNQQDNEQVQLQEDAELKHVDSTLINKQRLTSKSDVSDSKSGPKISKDETTIRMSKGSSKNSKSRYNEVCKKYEYNLILPCLVDEWLICSTMQVNCRFIHISIDRNSYHLYIQLLYQCLNKSLYLDTLFVNFEQPGIKHKQILRGQGLRSELTCRMNVGKIKFIIDKGGVKISNDGFLNFLVAVVHIFYFFVLVYFTFL